MIIKTADPFQLLDSKGNVPFNLYGLRACLCTHISEIELIYLSTFVRVIMFGVTRLGHKKRIVVSFFPEINWK